ncbi:MAG: DUF5522 domain-containing protein [Acidimicrobiales bacterium]
MEVPAPHPSRCDPSRADYADILTAHAAAVARGEPTYRDPTTGLSVMTSVALAERGTCCHSGCRHCPFVTG